MAHAGEYRARIARFPTMKRVLTARRVDPRPG